MSETVEPEKHGDLTLSMGQVSSSTQELAGVSRLFNTLYVDIWSIGALVPQTAHT